MNYHSQFCPEDSEVLFQHVDALRTSFSSDAIFLLESEDESERPTVILKVKDLIQGEEKLFQVEVVANSLFEAVEIACEVAKKLLVKAKNSTQKKMSAKIIH